MSNMFGKRNRGKQRGPTSKFGPAERAKFLEQHNEQNQEDEQEKLKAALQKNK